MGLSRRDKEQRALLAGLASEDRHERAFAVVGLAEANAAAALPSIERLADDADALVRGAVAYARARLGGELRDVEPLVALITAPDEEAVQLGVHALVQLGDAAVPALEAYALAKAKGRREVLDVLVDIGTKRAVAALQRCATSSNATLARVAQRALDDGQ